MNDEIDEHISNWIVDNGLDDPSKYIQWKKGQIEVDMDGSFSLEELIELVEYLKLQQENKKELD